MKPYVTANRRAGADHLLIVAALALGSLLSWPQAAAASASAFAFARPNLIITAEVSGPHTIIVNIINADDNIVVFEAKGLIVHSAAGAVSIGQVIDEPETDYRGDTWKYRAAKLIPPRSAGGITVLGAFRDLENIQRLAVKIGGRRYTLKPLDKASFDALAAKIEDLDIKAEDMEREFSRVGLGNIGSLRFPTGAGGEDADISGLITPDGINPPKIIAKRDPEPTPEAIEAGVEGVVKIMATITRDGGIVDARVIRGLGYGLDERALEAVKNSWRFLPATKDGEVVSGTATLDVEFKPPRRKQ